MDTARILLVDDDPDVRRFIAVNLQAEFDCEIHEAEDGDEGLNRAYTIRPDLVITDVTHRGLSGFEMTARLRQDPRTSSVPVIMITAKSRPDDRSDGIAAGATVYLTKPFDPRDLFAHVGEVLGLEPKSERSVPSPRLRIVVWPEQGPDASSPR